MPNKEQYWDQVCDMLKIRRMGKSKKEFRFRFLSDGVSVSLQYDREKSESQPIDLEAIRQKLRDCFFWYILGIDPGMKTWNATVRRTCQTGKEVNFTLSSKRYHWDTLHKTRNKKAKRFTKEYVAFERNDLNDRAIYPVMPSPLGRL